MDITGLNKTGEKIILCRVLVSAGGSFPYYDSVHNCAIKNIYENKVTGTSQLTQISIHTFRSEYNDLCLLADAQKTFNSRVDLRNAFWAILCPMCGACERKCLSPFFCVFFLNVLFTLNLLN